MRTMRRVLLLLLAVLGLSGAAAAAFVDVPTDHWAVSAVYGAVDRHVTTGFPDGTFRPAEAVSRGQLLAMLLRGVDPGGTDRAGADDAWWQPYYDAALDKGLLEGVFPAGADLNAPAARRELAALLVNADAACNGLRLTEGWVPEAGFADGDAAAVRAAAAAGLVSGYPDGTFRGGGNVTRAEACAAVLRLLDRAGWLGEGETQAVYTGDVLIKHTQRPDGGAQLTSVHVPEGAEIETLRVEMDSFAGFEDLRRQDRQQWARTWGRTVCGADQRAFWGEIGYYTYTEDGKMVQWTDRAVLARAADGAGIVAVSHRPGRRVWLEDAAGYRPAGDQVIRFGADGQVETLLSDRPDHGLCLTAVTGAAAEDVRVRREAADGRAWEYAVEAGKLRPLVHEAELGWAGFTPAEAEEELARLDALGAGIS